MQKSPLSPAVSFTRTNTSPTMESPIFCSTWVTPWSRELCQRQHCYLQCLQSRTGQEWGFRQRETPWSSRLGVGHWVDIPIP